MTELVDVSLQRSRQRVRVRSLPLAKSDNGSEADLGITPLSGGEPSNDFGHTGLDTQSELSLRECRHHALVHHLLAECIWQPPLETVADRYTRPPVVRCHEKQYAVVHALATDTPPVRQSGSERTNILAAKARHCHDCELMPCVVLKTTEPAREPLPFLGVEDARLIYNIARER